MYFTSVHVLLAAIVLWSVSIPCISALSPSSTPLPSLLDLSISDLSRLLGNGTLSSWALTHLYLSRIAEVNPTLHAVIQTSRHSALREAMRRDSERHMGLIRGPLHGIPILVKDNFATTGDTVTGAGSVCLAEMSRPTREATVVQKLRRAGAIILGKANLSEFSGGRGRNVSEGWSPLGGQTLGGYIPNQSPCGSSSGSAVAGSLGLAAAALGTETDGSITCPACLNNVVGVKPTVGLVSRFGVVPLTARQDTVGPLARSVEDAALILDAIAGQDGNDNYTSAQPWAIPPNYTAALDVNALRGRKIGVVSAEKVLDEFYYDANLAQYKELFDEALEDLRKAGAELVDVELDTGGLTLRDYVGLVVGNMTEYFVPDARESLERYMTEIAAHPDGSAANASALLDCMQTNPEEQASKWDITSIERMAHSNKSSGSEESWKAYTTAMKLSEDILLRPLRAHNLDALVSPMVVAILLTAVPGLPVVTVPMGALGTDAKTVWNRQNTTIVSAPGIPAGLTIVGDRWSEKELLGYAFAYEQISQKRRTLRPYILPETDLDMLSEFEMEDDDDRQQELRR